MQDNADYGIVICMSLLSMFGASVLLSSGFFMKRKEFRNFVLVSLYTCMPGALKYAHTRHAVLSL
jgi:hypothetical protein